MRRLSGFSLMEMMTVLLIVSIVAAASAPMISKKMSVAPAGAGGAGSCVWEESEDGAGIAYNIEGNKDQTVIIGAGNRPKNTQARLHIDSNAATSPHIMLTDSSTKAPTTARLIYNNGGFGLTTSADALGKDAVTIGAGAATSQNSIAIGSGASANVTKSIAIGVSANASAANTVYQSIAIGDSAKTYGSQCVSIGTHTESGSKEADYAIAIGTYQSLREYQPYRPGEIRTEATGKSSIALGRAAQAEQESAIAIGTVASAGGTYATAIGAGATASAANSIAIGRSANAIEAYTTAIGDWANASANNSTAIGAGAVANQPHQIVLGTQDDTVYIPGNLIVGGYSYFGSNLKGSDCAVAGQWGWNAWQGVVEVNSEGILHLSKNSSNYTARDADSAPGYDLALNYIKGGGWRLPSDSSTSSDRRLKNVGKAFVGGLKELKKLDLFHYTYKKDKSNTPHVGVMAQDLQKVFPDAVTKGEDGFLRIRMEDMFYALVNAVKELASMFDKQDEKIAQLEKENKQLQKTVADLEKQNSEILKRLAKLEKQK